MKYVGTLLQGDNTFDYLDNTLLVRPDPPGAVQYMTQEGKSINDTITIDGHATSFGGESAIFVDGLFDTFQGTLVNSADPEHRVEAMLIHPRLAPRGGSGPARRASTKPPGKGKTPGGGRG